MKISHSAIQEYNECGEKYRLNRIEKIRPETKSSAFVFGSAIDEACDSILTGKDDYNEKFLEEMENTEINGTLYRTRECHLMKYFAKDLQVELLEPHTLMKIDTDAADILDSSELFDITEFIKEMKGAKKYNSTDEEKSVFNMINYECVLAKGVMMLEVLKEWVDENIEEVISIQKELRTENEEGDVLRGFVDFIAKFKDGVTRIVDLKTASDPKRQYPDDCIENSQQLTIYSEIEGISEVAYFVLDKNIRKREPRVRSRYVSGKITPENANIIFDKIEDTLVDLKKEVFEPNLDSCHNYGGCPYRSYCKSGGENINGLIKLPKQEKKND